MLVINLFIYINCTGDGRYQVLYTFLTRKSLPEKFLVLNLEFRGEFRPETSQALNEFVFSFSFVCFTALSERANYGPYRELLVKNNSVKRRHARNAEHTVWPTII